MSFAFQAALSTWCCWLSAQCEDQDMWGWGAEDARTPASCRRQGCPATFFVPPPTAPASVLPQRRLALLAASLAASLGPMTRLVYPCPCHGAQRQGSVLILGGRREEQGVHAARTAQRLVGHSNSAKCSLPLATLHGGLPAGGATSPAHSVSGPVGQALHLQLFRGP